MHDALQVLGVYEFHECTYVISGARLPESEWGSTGIEVQLNSGRFAFYVSALMAREVRTTIVLFIMQNGDLGACQQKNVLSSRPP